MRLRLLLSSMALAAVCIQPAIGGQQVTGRPMAFSAVSMNGKRVFIRDLVQDGPVFLYFIRYGDPVNDQFAGKLNKIINTYSPGNTKWFGIITSDRSRADSWIAEFQPPYDMLMDQNLSLVQGYGVVSSPTVIKVGTDGQIMNEWNGFSGYRLKQINAAAASANGVSVKYIDFNDTPSTTRYGAAFIQKREGG